MTAILSVKGLRKVFRVGAAEYEALADISFDVNQGELLTVVGPYPIEIDAEAEGFSPAGRKHVRETIRLSGPSAGSTKLTSSTGGAHV